MGEDLPESSDAAIPKAFKREGARKMLDNLWDWEPQSVRDERAMSGGKLEELDNEY